MIEKIKAVMIGHAVGDALGVPVEFCSREEKLNSLPNQKYTCNTIADRLCLCYTV